MAISQNVTCYTEGFTLWIDHTALLDHRSVVGAIIDRWRCAIDSADGAVQSCANDHAALHDIRYRTCFMNNQLCSRGSEHHRSTVAPLFDGGTKERSSNSNSVARLTDSANPPIACNICMF